MPKYRQSNATAKTGINFVRTIVEGSNCILHKIEQDSDLGIDCLIELIRNETPLNKQLAFQVKSGESYYVPKAEEFLIPINNHREYWAHYPLPVFGLVYVPSLGTAYWTNIKNHLKKHPSENTIRFKRTRINEFNKESFSQMFVPLALRETPNLPFDYATSLLQSDHLEESHLAATVLFRKYPNHRMTWDYLVTQFKDRPTDKIPTSLIYYFAHVPWHPDIFGYGESLTPDTKHYIASEHFNRFQIDEIIKLLNFIDEESTLSRGSIGQSVDAIISSLPNNISLLKSILNNPKIPIFNREMAAAIYAQQEPEDAIPLLENLSKEGSTYANDVIYCIQEFGFFNPYH